MLADGAHRGKLASDDIPAAVALSVKILTCVSNSAIRLLLSSELVVGETETGVPHLGQLWWTGRGMYLGRMGGGFGARATAAAMEMGDVVEI